MRIRRRSQRGAAGVSVIEPVEHSCSIKVNTVPRWNALILSGDDSRPGDGYAWPDPSGHPRRGRPRARRGPGREPRPDRRRRRRRPDHAPPLLPGPSGAAGRARPRPPAGSRTLPYARGSTRGRDSTPSSAPARRACSSATCSRSCSPRSCRSRPAGTRTASPARSTRRARAGWRTSPHSTRMTPAGCRACCARGGLPGWSRARGTTPPHDVVGQPAHGRKAPRTPLESDWTTRPALTHHRAHDHAPGKRGGRPGLLSRRPDARSARLTPPPATPPTDSWSAGAKAYLGGRSRRHEPVPAPAAPKAHL